MEKLCCRLDSDVASHSHGLFSHAVNSTPTPGLHSTLSITGNLCTVIIIITMNN